MYSTRLSGPEYVSYFLVVINTQTKATPGEKGVILGLQS